MKRMLPALIAACCLASFAYGEGSTVSGTVKWEGDVPPMKDIDMSGDAVCHAAHKEPVKTQTLVLGADKGMANVIVMVKSGLPADKKYDAPKEAVTVHQHGCMYEPHVFVLRAGQEIKFANEDGIMHNVNSTFAKKNRGFNLSMNKDMKESEAKKFAKAEAPFAIKCDVHPWMLGWCAVVDHPFYAVTKEDGKFSLAGLPPGEYEIEAWHEKLGSQTQKVTVAEGAGKELNFSFTKKK